MAKVRVGINGFGRIGRGFVRCLADAPGTFDLVLINDLTDVATLGHLLKHDSVHGRFPGTVTVEDGALIINGDKVTITAKKDPAEIPWKEHGVDIVLDVIGGDYLDRDVAAAALHGRIVQVGTLPPEGLHFPANDIMVRELDYVGAFRAAHAFDWAVRYLRTRRVDVRPLLSAQLPISRAAEAFELAADRSRSTKVQLVCD